MLFSKGERCHCFLHEDELNDSHTSSAVSKLCETYAYNYQTSCCSEIESLLIWCVSYSVKLWDRNTDVFITNRAQKHGHRKLLLQGKFSQSSEITLICQVCGRAMECVYMHKLLFKHTGTHSMNTHAQMTHLTGRCLDSLQYEHIFGEVWYSQTQTYWEDS